MRAKGVTSKCIVLTALIDHWKSGCSPDISEDSSGSVVDAVCAQIEASEDAVNNHITDELAPIKAALLQDPRETTKEAIKRMSGKMTDLRRTRADEIVKEKEAKKEAEKKKEEQAAKTAEGLKTEKRKT